MLALSGLIFASSAFAAPLANQTSTITNNTKFNVCVLYNNGNSYVYLYPTDTASFDLPIYSAFVSSGIVEQCNPDTSLGTVTVQKTCDNKETTSAQIIGGNIDHLQINCKKM